MPLKKKDLATRLTESDEAFIKVLEAKIDHVLESCWIGQTVSIELREAEYPKKPSVRDRLVAGYESAGWKLEFTFSSDQRDGNSYYARVS